MQKKQAWSFPLISLVKSGSSEPVSGCIGEFNCVLKVEEDHEVGSADKKGERPVVDQAIL